MPTATRIFDTKIAAEPFDLSRSMLAVQAAAGKKFMAQVSEIAKLSLGPGKLRPDEYYYYRLYEDDLSLAEKREFIGRRLQEKIIRQCDPVTWWALPHDKILFNALIMGLGLPAAEIAAVYHPSRGFGRTPVVADEDALAEYLRSTDTYPFFAKPATGIYSLGTVSASQYGSADDSVVLAGGDEIPVKEFAAAIVAHGGDGYIFQERLTPHPDIAAIVGDRVSTARLMVMVSEKGPEILHALWKIPARDHVADNFWRAGNMLGVVDAATGRVGRVVQGAGPDQVVVESHPDSGRPVTGVTLPGWQRLVDTCLEGAAAIPELRLQAWDVAMCDNGPVLLELNVGGDFNLPQVATGRGLMDERFRAFIESCTAGE